MTPEAPQPAVPRGRIFQTVTIDPGHGGADTGARGSPESGSAGTVEKDLTLAWAKRLRAELQSRLQLTVLLTRDRDVSPTLDERAAIANASRSDLFVSLHVSTAGKPRTARVYTWRPSQDESQVSPHGRFLSWEAAQLRSREDSERFAELLESQLGRLLPGSSAKPAEVPLRVLRSVAGPAVAIEVSSVGAEPRQLAGIEQALATAIVSAIQSFKPIYERVGASNQLQPPGTEGVARAQPAREKNETTRPQEDKPQAGKP